MRMSSTADVLRAFLEHPDRPEGTLTFDQLRGFFFAVVNAPELIMPSDWIPAIFGDGNQSFADVEEADTIHQALQREYNAVNEFSLMVVQTEDGALPPETSLLEDPMANLADDAPIHAWCQGFREGHRWLIESWNAFLDEGDEAGESEMAEMSKELGALLMVLCFFSSRQIAEAFCNETRAKDMTKLAETMHHAFPLAVRDYVRLGRMMQLVSNEWQESETGMSSPAERNAPCPCGSGREYQRCCGVTH
jgi:uncharacterized protein